MLAVLASSHRSGGVDTSLAKSHAVPPAQTAPADGDPLAGAAQNAAGPAAPPPAGNSAVPLAR